MFWKGHPLDILKKIVAETDNSISTKLRKKRFTLFKNLISAVSKPYRILDVGGRQIFWELMDFNHTGGVEIDLYNIQNIDVSHPNFKNIIGDARDMRKFKDNEYDIVFSNSLIEHVGDYENQLRVAKEIRRIGRRYFVQTPNRYFPIEPHFVFPFFHYFSPELRVFLIRNFNIGVKEKNPELKEAIQAANRIRLLCEQELKELFPEATIIKEKFLSITKSFIIYDGWDDAEKPGSNIML